MQVTHERGQGDAEQRLVQEQREGEAEQTLLAAVQHRAGVAAEIEERLPPPAVGPKMTVIARRVHERVARLNAAQQRVVLGVMEAMGS